MLTTLLSSTKMVKRWKDHLFQHFQSVANWMENIFLNLGLRLKIFLNFLKGTRSKKVVE